MLKLVKRVVLPAGIAGLAVGSFLIYDDRKADKRYNVPHHSVIPSPIEAPRTRAQIMESIRSGNEYDVLIIGGGATGTGVALDAVTRKLKVALVERADFASETSSRSTKLVHGGVRYLEKAFWQADYGQYKLVREALAERKRFIDMAPHLAFPLPIMIPVYKWWQLPYYYIGVKAYDMIAGSANLDSSYMLTRTRALQLFPMLNDSELKGAIVYFDGSQNDSRTNATLAVSAIDKGADILNYVEVQSLVKDKDGKVTGAQVIDKEAPDSKPFVIKAKSVVNATGPFTDSIRKMDNQNAQDIEIASSGVHVVLPGWYAPKMMGLLDAATSDGRVVFFLPWQGSVLAGTTDKPCSVTSNPVPTEEEINFVLNEVRHYIDGQLEISRDDVRSAWAGIRPLVRDPHALNTQNVVRSHTVHVSESGLVTIAGGKWTTFREMAEETVDTVVEHFNLKAGPCVTKLPDFKLIGGANWSPLMYIDLIREFGIESNSARHLSENYGTRAFEVARLCTPTVLDAKGNVLQRNARLSPLYPFLDGEVIYAVKHEYARTAMDVLARRTRLAFLDVQAAKEALPSVIEVMAEQLHWDTKRQEEEYASGLNYLLSFGLAHTTFQAASPASVQHSQVVPAAFEPSAEVAHPR